MASVAVTLDPSTSHYIFAVTNFNSKSYTFTRTHLEVDRLYSHLRITHPDHIIPAYPPQSNDTNLLISLLTKFLSRILGKQALASSDCVMEFLTSEFQFCPDSPSSQRKSVSGGFLESLIGKNNITDIDYYFETSHVVTTQLDTHLISLGKCCERLAKNDKLFSLAWSEVATKFATFPTLIEPSLVLVKKFVKCCKINEDIYSNNANSLASTFFDACCYQSRASFSALSSLNHRLSVLSKYDTQVKQTAKKIAALEKLKGSRDIKSDKVDSLHAELVAVKAIEIQAKEELKCVSVVVKNEYTDYVLVRDVEICEMLDVYVKQQVLVAKSLLKVWRGFERELGVLL